MYEAGATVDTVYFPTTAVISLVVSLSTGEMIEAAMGGRGGVVGATPPSQRWSLVPAALDGKVSISRAIVQIGGSVLACRAATLKVLALQNANLLALLIRHERAVYARAQQPAACNVTHNVEARMARWLLRARDLAGPDTLSFTQKFLGEMLGVRRTSVSLVAHTLQDAGLIRYTRGNIQITDLDGLQETACECYETIRKHYSVLVGAFVAGDGAVHRCRS